MKASVLELGNLIQGFKLCCQTEGKSPKTIEWYTTFLYRFLAFLEFSNYPTDVAQINKEVIRAFILYLQSEARTPRSKKPLSPATVQGYVRTLKSFFSWVVREEYLPDSPTAKVPVPKAPQKVINTFTHEQIGKLAQACYRSNGNGYRNLTILLLLLDSGIRVSELVNINCEDVNLAEGWVNIRIGKGGKERIVPVGSVVQKSLWKYINHFRSQPLTQKVTRLFLSDDGLPLTRSGIQQMLKKLGLVEELHFNEAHHHYEIKPSNEHHHLVCLGCGQVVEFEYPLAHRVKRNVAEAKDFEIIDTKLWIDGYCSKCR